MIGLNDPLGTGSRSRRPDASFLLKGALGTAVALVGLGAAYAAATADPRAGEPIAVAAIPAEMVAPRPPRAAAPFPANDAASVAPAPLPIMRGDRGDAASTALSGAAGGSSETVEGGVKVFRGEVPPSRSAPSQQVVVRSGVPGAAPRPTSSLDGAQGVAPLVIDVSKALDDPFDHRSKAGETPSDPAAKKPTPFEKAFAAAKPAVAPAPRVAIFVGGMGLDAAATKAALDMPAAVTLAFVPSGETTVSLAAAATARGHEILLQLPMANGAGPAPGPHALKPGMTTDRSRLDLAWMMDRLKGYDGMVNLLGAPVTADDAVMSGVIETARRRGLFVLDDGTSRRNRTLALAADLHVPAARADVVLDATSDPAAVRANLDQLVAIARRRGTAIGMASGLPEHLGTIARFAAALAAKGVTLVPVGELVRHDSEVASAR